MSVISTVTAATQKSLLTTVTSLPEYANPQTFGQLQQQHVQHQTSTGDDSGDTDSAAPVERQGRTSKGLIFAVSSWVGALSKKPATPLLLPMEPKSLLFYYLQHRNFQRFGCCHHRHRHRCLAAAHSDKGVVTLAPSMESTAHGSLENDWELGKPILFKKSLDCFLDKMNLDILLRT
ncbi:hypothetical protein ACA910_014931 [Epithemia clementina (nom. ined.)]